MWINELTWPGAVAVCGIAISIAFIVIAFFRSL